MEAIGAVASISQLANYFFGSWTSLREAYLKAKLQPEHLRRELQHIERLHETVESIQGSALPERIEIFKQVNALYELVLALNITLKDLLARQNRTFIKRFLSAWIKDSRNTRLESILATAEVEKTSLILSITSAQAHSQDAFQKEVLGTLNSTCCKHTWVARKQILNPQKYQWHPKSSAREIAVCRKCKRT